jgi:uncharacterized membrane protein YidH (DUF202 family)
MCCNTGMTQALPGPAGSLLLRLARPDRTRKTVFVLAAIILIIGGVLAGTGISSIQAGQALVSQLRQHSAVATAVISDFQNRTVQTRGGTATVADWGFAFRLPGRQTALTEDTGFDGTYSAAPPANDNATRQVVVRYDPANVNAVLPASVVAHPSYRRLMVQVIAGLALCAIALALARWWYRRERRRRAAWRASQRPGTETISR